jgi:hypothetical protein
MNRTPDKASLSRLQLAQAGMIVLRSKWNHYNGLWSIVRLNPTTGGWIRYQYDDCETREQADEMIRTLCTTNPERYAADC